MKLNVVYTNQTSRVGEIVDLLEEILRKHKETKAIEKTVVGFDLEYMKRKTGEVQTVTVAQLCVENHVLVCHYHYAAPSPSERFANFINSDAYEFSIVDANNDRRVLEDTSLSCQNLVDIQEQYKIKNTDKSKDSLGDLSAAIIDPIFLNVKGDAKKNKLYKKWANFPLDDEHVSYVARDAYVGYEVYRRIALMRECLVNI